MRRVRPVCERPSGNTAETSAGRGILFQWFPTWWGWTDNSVAIESVGSDDTQESSVEQQIEGQLLDALADTVENNSLLRRDVVFCQMNFTLKEGTFHLCSTDKDIFPEGQLQGDSK